MAAIGAALAGAVTAAELAGGAFAQTNPTNDLFAIGLGSGDTPAAVPVVHRPEPPFAATPAPASCGPGSHPEPGLDGRVPAGTAANSLSCNLTLSATRVPRAASRSSATSTPRGTSAPSTTRR